MATVLAFPRRNRARSLAIGGLGLLLELLDEPDDLVASVPGCDPVPPTALWTRPCTCSSHAWNDGNVARALTAATSWAV